MKSKPVPVYKPKALIPGFKIEKGLTGFYAGVPDKTYKGKEFQIRFIYFKKEIKKFIDITKEIKDWNRAEKFRRFMDKWGRGPYTLGYFKMCEEL
jgi:hypothetical protein